MVLSQKAKNVLHNAARDGCIIVGGLGQTKGVAGITLVHLVRLGYLQRIDTRDPGELSRWTVTDAGRGALRGQR